MYYYCIMKTSDITQSMIQESVCTEKTMRRNNDNTESILKFDTEFPDTMAGYTLMTKSEVKSEIALGGWD